MSTKDTTSNCYRFAGLLTGIVFSSEDDIEYDTYSLHKINRPLDTEDNFNNVNTLSSKFLGPVITDRENCKVCFRSPIDSPGHCGIIKGLPIIAAPGRDDAIFEMIKHVCVICFSVSISDKCNCGADLPTTRRGQPGQFTIHIGDNRTISLDSWAEVYGYLTQLNPANINKLIKLVYPNSSAGFGINNLFTKVIIVPPNIMRPETPVKGQNKMMPSIDTKNLNAIVSQLINDNRSIGVGESSKLISAIYNYYSLEVQQQSTSLGLFDLNADENKSAFVDMLTKYGFLRRYAIGKITFGIGRMVNTSGNMLPLTTIGLNTKAGRQYQVRHVVNKTNIRALMIMLSFRKIREMATIIKRDGRVFKGTSQFKFDYLPSFGDTIYLPAKKKILVVNRQPTKGRRSMLAMVAEVLGLSTGAYLNSLVADLLDGDYDGDELSVSKLRERASELGVYITMSIAGLLYSDRRPGVEFGLIDEAIIGIAKLSLTKIKFTKAEFFGLFLKTTLPFFYKDQEFYTGGDVITSILYDTKLTYKIKSYDVDSVEYAKFGDEYMNLEIIDGIYLGGLVADLAVGRNSRSIFSRLSFLVNPYKVLEKISMFYWIGIAASSLFGNSFAINQLVSSERNYNLLKASKNVTIQKVQSMIDAYQFKTSISDVSLIQLLEQIAIPNPKYLGLYNKNLAVPPYSEFKSNDLELSNMCGLGPNSKQINAYVGYGYMNIINGGVSSESLLYGRMAPSERIGDHKAIPLGFVEGNISLGYTAEDQFKQRSLAATAFSTKVILVSKPGAQLNNSKMFFESMIISSLDEIKYNGITIQRFGGRCNLIPGKCVYFSIKNY